MSITILSFDKAIRAASGAGKVHALLGNGFSRACRDDIFSYSALFDRADFQELSPYCRSAFDALETTDFEVVIKALRNASALIQVYRPKLKSLAKSLKRDADNLREVLVNAIASSHPDWPGEIEPHAYAACKKFLAHFERIYTANYDLLLYWAYMQEEIEPQLDCDDGFRKPNSGEEEYVSWEVENSFEQKIYYLHGALHLFDAGAELQKYTWKNTGVRLTDQIRTALKASKYPLFVSEGTSEEKLERIKHSGYLHRGLASMPKISGTLFAHGLSFAENDEHIIQMIEKGGISSLYVSIFGPPTSAQNNEIITRVKKMPTNRQMRSRRKRPLALNVHFYDAQSAAVWG